VFVGEQAFADKGGRDIHFGGLDKANLIERVFL
jgi:hypothetical protein